MAAISKQFLLTKMLKSIYFVVVEVKVHHFNRKWNTYNSLILIATYNKSLIHGSNKFSSISFTRLKITAFFLYDVNEIL